MEPTKENIFDPVTMTLLTNIKERIEAPEELRFLTKVELATDIVRAVIREADLLNTPILRNGQRFFIYRDHDQIEISKRGVKQFLVWVTRHYGVAESLATERDFMDVLFSKAWRYFSED
jgi:hypothetical protein